jgi:hypothetical protein
MCVSLYYSLHYSDCKNQSLNVQVHMEISGLIFVISIC